MRLLGLGRRFEWWWSESGWDGLVAHSDLEEQWGREGRGREERGSTVKAGRLL